MSSVRVPTELRERLNEAAPEGTPLHQVIEELLENAGGPEIVRERLKQASRWEEARARVARLHQRGHRSVCMSEDEQIALAQATARWCRLLEDRGLRRWDPEARSLELTVEPPDPGSTGLRPEGRFSPDRGVEP